MATRSSRGPNLSALARITDPVAAQQFQQVLSRLAKLEGDLAGLSLSAVGNSGPIRANNQPLQLLRDPQYGQTR
jgi:hypothetical protein